MAGNGDTIVIDITTEYKDNTDSGLEKASKKADKFTESMVKAKKQVEALKKTDATVDLKANDQATATIEKTKRSLKTLTDANGAVTLRAKDEATAAILKAQAEIKKLHGTTASPKISLIDKATAGLAKVTGKINTIAGKTFSFTAAVVDKVTAPLRSMVNYATSLKGIMTGVFTAIAANAAIMDPVNFADKMTTSNIGFETKLGSADAANSFMGDIEKFAIKTPFETSDLIDTSQRMLAMNWDVAKILPDLEKIGNASAATGKGAEGVERISTALSQMRMKGKVSAEEMLQLTEVGVNGWKYLADSVGATIPEVQAMTEKGLIPVEDAISGIIGGMGEFDGMMEKTANKTVGGLKSQIKDTFDTKLVLKWGQGLQTGGIAALSSINEWLGKNADKVQVWGEKLKTIGTDLSTAAGDVAKGALDGLDAALNRTDFDSADLLGKTQIVWEEVISKPLEKWWSSGGEARVQEIFAGVATTIGKVITEGIPIALKAVFSNDITGTIAIGYGLKTGLSVAKGISDGIGSAKDTFKMAKDFLGIGAAAAEGAQGIGIMAKLAGTLGSSLVAVAGPIGIAVAAIGGIITICALAEKRQKEYREELSKLGDTYTEAVKTMDGAQKAYDEESDKLKENTNLIKEYNDIKGQVNSGSLNGDEQTTALTRQEEILIRLKDLYPKAFGEGVSVDQGLANAQSMIDKEQEYQNLVLARAKLEYSQAILDISLKLPDIQTEMTRIQEELDGEHGLLQKEVKLTAQADSFTTLQSDIDQYKLDLSKGMDTSGIEKKITDELSAMNADDSLGAFGDSIVQGVARSFNNDTTIGEALTTNINDAQKTALNSLADISGKVIEDKLQLSNYNSQLAMLKQGTDDLGISTVNLGTNLMTNQTTAGATQTVVDDTLKKSQDAETASKSASDNAAQAVTDTQTAQTNADGLQGKIDTAKSSLGELNGAMGELDTGGFSEKLTGLIGITDTTLETIRSTIETKSAEAVTQAETKFAELGTYVNNLTPEFYKYGQAMMQELVSGIDSMKSNAGGEIDEVVGIMLEKFRTGLGIHSPSTILREIGRYAMKGLMMGLGGEDLAAFCNRIVEDIKSAFDQGSFNLKVGTEFIGSGAADFFKSIGVGGATVEGLLKPVDGAVTSEFGWRESPTAGASSNHPGLDIGAPEGTPVYAAGAGEVTTAGSYGGYGNAVVIDHGNGLETLYGHLSKVLVSVGEMVNQMQEIGAVGSTGISTGPHLHFGIYQNGEAIDPSGLYGYATGTKNATPGIHWVGEKGPELVGFNGGEAVLNNYQSKNFSDTSGSTGGELAQIIQFPTTTKESEVEKVGQEYGEKFKNGITSMKDPVIQVVKDFTDAVMKEIQEALDASKLTTGTGTGGTGGDWQNMDAAGWIKEAMSITGVTGDDNFNHLMEIAQNESSFDPNAINDWDSNAMAGTPSMGLMQTIQSTFDAYAGEGKDIWNPIDNAVAAINYMIDTYGSVLNTGTHGYATGIRSAPSGPAWVGEKGPELMNFAGGESVINADESAKIVSMNSARSRRGSYTNTTATTQSEGNGSAIEINLGGIHITIEAGNAGTTEEVIAAVQAQMPGIANELCLEIARQIEQIYSGMPMKVGA